MGERERRMGIGRSINQQIFIEQLPWLAAGESSAGERHIRKLSIKRWLWGRGRDVFFWNRIEGKAGLLCCRTPGGGCCAACSLGGKRCWSWAAQGPAHQTRGEEADPRKTYGPARGGGEPVRERAHGERTGACSPTLLPFLLRALDATLSTSQITPTVTWALMPSLKWTPRPATSPRASWRSEMWLLRPGSANTQVGRVALGGRLGCCEWEGREAWGWGLVPAKLSLVHQSPQERVGLCPWGGEDEGFILSRRPHAARPALPLQGLGRYLAGVGFGGPPGGCGT